MERGFTRRQILGRTAALGAAGVLASRLPLVSAPARASGGELSATERVTLDAALARMIPRDHDEDWSAADVGAGEYIVRLLSGDPLAIYAGGPGRADFAAFQMPSRVKRMGWANEVARLRTLYHEGLEELDRRAGGEPGAFAAAPADEQDAILTQLDMEGSRFFEALYEHTMEAVYGHPAYRGNEDYRPWTDLRYEGDVHYRRYPAAGNTPGSWDVHGGYAPEEIAEPGGDE